MAVEWEAFLADLQQTLDKFAVPQAEQAEIKACWWMGSCRWPALWSNSLVGLGFLLCVSIN
jgi:hypothetical protein